MGLIGKRRAWKLALAALLLPALAATSQSKAKQASSGPTSPPNSKPAARIAVGPLGYVAPSAAYIGHRLSFATLDFIDKNHLLFTFHVNELLPRIPDDPADDDDQMIHAVVLDIASGKVLRQADWRMHDKGRYLWALRDGKFLVRVRNTLFFTDSSLGLQPYLNFDTDLQGVEVSPSRGLLMVEVKKALPPKESGTEGNVPPSLVSPEGTQRVRTQIMLVRPGEHKALGGAQALTPIYVPLLENGFLDVDEGKRAKDWVIMKKLLDKTTAVVGTVKSSCDPKLMMLSEDVVLSQGCPEHGGRGSDVSALALNGEVLWRDHWDSRYIWPEFASSEDGSRFAFESLEMNRDIGTLDVFGEQDVVAQPVGVFDTKSGNLVLVKNASPVLSAGQNFALSADGRRFAILRQGAIEIYDLPPVAAVAPKIEKKK